LLTGNLLGGLAGGGRHLAGGCLSSLWCGGGGLASHGIGRLRGGRGRLDGNGRLLDWFDLGSWQLLRCRSTSLHGGLGSPIRGRLLLLTRGSLYVTGLLCSSPGWFVFGLLALLLTAGLGSCDGGSAGLQLGVAVTCSGCWLGHRDSRILGLDRFGLLATQLGLLVALTRLGNSGRGTLLGHFWLDFLHRFRHRLRLGGNRGLWLFLVRAFDFSWGWLGHLGFHGFLEFPLHFLVLFHLRGMVFRDGDWFLLTHLASCLGLFPHL
jgi:hypothetical protein